MHSAPHANVFPALRYTDADAAMQWLQRAFGFTVTAVHRGESGTVEHAELDTGGGLVMLGQHSGAGWMGGTAPDPLGSPIGIYVVIADPDAHHAQAVAAGATIVRELEDQSYGSRDYSARDPEGNLWSFGTYDPYNPPE
jgi:uncharacterized glyoxalase superfamily protein PhnB